MKTYLLDLNAQLVLGANCTLVAVKESSPPSARVHMANVLLYFTVKMF